MDPFTVYCLMLGALGAVGTGFVLWVAPRIDERERRRAVPISPCGMTSDGGQASGGIRLMCRVA